MQALLTALGVDHKGPLGTVVETAMAIPVCFLLLRPPPPIDIPVFVRRVCNEQ